LLPAASRQAIYDDWYQSGGQLKTMVVYHDLDTQSPTRIPFKTDKPQQELLSTLKSRYPDLTGLSCTSECGFDSSSVIAEQTEHAMQRLTRHSAQSVPGIRWLPEISFLRVNSKDGDYRVYSLLRNRRHSNVAFIFGESLRYQEELDTLTVLPQLIGSYPNIIFQADLSEIELFSDMLARVDSKAAFSEFVRRWGVLRTSPNFWPVFHSFSDHMRKYNPVQAGLYDLNRYDAW